MYEITFYFYNFKLLTFETLLLVVRRNKCHSVMAKMSNCSSLSCANPFNHLWLISGLNLVSVDLGFVVATSKWLFVGSLKAIAAFEVRQLVCLWLTHHSLLVRDNSTSWVLRKLRILCHLICFLILVYYL